MNLSQILEILGPAQRDLGSGLTILEWDSTDGRKFSLAFSELAPSSKPLSPGSFSK